MAEASAVGERLAAAGIEVQADLRLCVASLRYFEANGPFTAAIRTATGTEIPGALGAVVANGTAGEAPIVLAWRSPSETLALTADRTRQARLASAVAPAAGGCLVDLTGGLRVLRVRGERIADLLSRLGGDASIPALNESRPSRLADVPAIALCVQARETLVAVDRGYSEHVLGWIRATLADWGPD